MYHLFISVYFHFFPSQTQTANDVTQPCSFIASPSFPPHPAFFVFILIDFTAYECKLVPGQGLLRQSAIMNGNFRSALLPPLHTASPSGITQSTPPPAAVVVVVEAMSQDAEDGPELLEIVPYGNGMSTHSTHSYPNLPSPSSTQLARRPMNQEEFDERFHYTRPKAVEEHTTPAHLLQMLARPYYRPFTSCRQFVNTLLGVMPILQWLPQYKWRESIMADVVGGLTVGVMHVPQGIAYALLAKVPPVVGLYTSFFPPLFYMLFGTSRHNSIGSFAVVALMAGMAVEKVMVDEGWVDADGRGG